MSLTTVARTWSGMRRAARAAGRLAAATLLLAVPILALAILAHGMPFLSMPKLAVAPPTAPMTFDAPALTVAKTRASVPTAHHPVAGEPRPVQEKIIPLEAWNYTITRTLNQPTPSPSQ